MFTHAGFGGYSQEMHIFLHVCLFFFVICVYFFNSNTLIKGYKVRTEILPGTMQELTLCYRVNSGTIRPSVGEFGVKSGNYFANDGRIIVPNICYCNLTHEIPTHQPTTNTPTTGEPTLIPTTMNPTTQITVSSSLNPTTKIPTHQPTLQPFSFVLFVLLFCFVSKVAVFVFVLGLVCFLMPGNESETCVFYIF